jgi:hypothetical protein
MLKAAAPRLDLLCLFDCLPDRLSLENRVLVDPTCLSMRVRAALVAKFSLTQLLSTNHFTY